MNSPSRQWDLLPFEFPFTQFAYFVPPSVPIRHGSSVGGFPTFPLVHWSMFAATLRADAELSPSAMGAITAVNNDIANIVRKPTRRARRLGSDTPYLLCFRAGGRLGRERERGSAGCSGAESHAHAGNPLQSNDRCRASLNGGHQAYKPQM